MQLLAPFLACLLDKASQKGFLLLSHLAKTTASHHLDGLGELKETESLDVDSKLLIGIGLERIELVWIWDLLKGTEVTFLTTEGL